MTEPTAPQRDGAMDCARVVRDEVTERMSLAD